MPLPIALCLEDVNAASADERYLRCVALAGGEPGLVLDPAGQAHWMGTSLQACQLWVSMDQRLVLWRPIGAPPVQVSRAGRSLDVPLEKPVILRDQDQVAVGTRHLRVHIHGLAPAVHGPTPLVVEPRAPQRTLAHAAAALAFMVGTAGCSPAIEVRAEPPKVAPIEESPPPPVEEPPPPAIPEMDDPQVEPPLPPIEVREHPPAPMPPSYPPPMPPVPTPDPPMDPPPATDDTPPPAAIPELDEPPPAVTPDPPPIEVRPAPPSVAMPLPPPAPPAPPSPPTPPPADDDSKK